MFKNIFLLHLLIFPSALWAKARYPKPVEKYSLTEGKEVSIPAKKTTLPLIVFGDEAGQASSYVPSGFMGDADKIKMKAVEGSAPLKTGAPGVNSLRVDYLFGTDKKSRSPGAGWAGVYWLTPANNWAKMKGGGYDLSSAQKLTFWIKGDKGGEIIAQVKVGGLVGPYPDTDSVSMGPIRLSTSWEKYSIDLREKDLRHIVGGFLFSIRRLDNPKGAVFYLDEIMFEGLESSVKPEEISNFALEKSTDSSITNVRHRPLNKNKNIPPETLTYVIAYSKADAAFLNEGKKILDDVAEEAKKYSEAALEINGHTDNIGSEEVNKKLSLQRARSVADYLETKGINRERMKVTGFGEEKPVSQDSNSTRSGQQQNRRVEIILLAD